MLQSASSLESELLLS